MKTHKQAFTELLTELTGIEPRLREPRVQIYFEQNAELICPEHYLAPRTVISKLRIGADFACDFAYFAPVSGANYLNLVENQRPDSQPLHRQKLHIIVHSGGCRASPPEPQAGIEPQN